MRCDNCGQPALEGDVVCWHCGRPLGSPAPPAGNAVPAPSEQPALDLRSAGLYLGLTAAVILGAILLMAALGRQPLLLVDGRSRPLPGWRQLAPADRAFTLLLPENWTSEAPGPDGPLDEALGRVAAAALRPLGDDAGDLELLFVAQSPPPPVAAAPAVLAVGRSRALNQLSYPAAAERLAASRPPAREVSFVDYLAKSHLSIVVPVGADPETRLLCRQQFIRGRDEAMLVGLCAPAGRFAVYQTTFTTILASFQRLSS